MDSRDLSPVPTAPAASPAGYSDARSWAEAEIAEWLVEADEEASAIIDRARAEALRCELAGHEELERLREEAVNVRMATAERVARRLNEARFEADQLLAEAGTQAETMVEDARDVVRHLLGGLAELGRELTNGAGDQVARAAARLEGLLADGALAIPGRSGVLDLTGAVILDPGSRRVSYPGALGTDEVVMDDTDLTLTSVVAPVTPITGAAAPAAAPAPAGAAPAASMVVPVADRVRPPTGAMPSPVQPPPTQVLALPVKAGEGLRSVDDILPAPRTGRVSASAWWDRLARFVRRAA